MPSVLFSKKFIGRYARSGSLILRIIPLWKHLSRLVFQCGAFFLLHCFSESKPIEIAELKHLKRPLRAAFFIYFYLGKGFS